MKEKPPNRAIKRRPGGGSRRRQGRERAPQAGTSCPPRRASPGFAAFRPFRDDAAFEAPGAHWFARPRATSSSGSIRNPGEEKESACS